MLAQLVCVDRRFQRMNCFNIRELQSMLKRRFFTDLVSSNDHRELLNNSMIGLRFKTNSNNTLDTDMLNFYNLGTTVDTKIKSTEYINTGFISTVTNYSGVTYLSGLINALYTPVYRLFTLLITEEFMTASNLPDSYKFFNTHYYNTVLAFDDFMFNIVRVIQNVSVYSLSALLPSLNTFFEVIA